MFKVQTSIYLSLPPEYAFKTLSELDNYSEIFPFYVNTRKVKESLYSSTWENTALMLNTRFSIKGKPFVWKSEYRLQKDKLRISTIEIGPKAPLKSLQAEWYINREREGTKVVLVHYFEIRNWIFTKYLLYIIVQFIINSNAQRLLINLKKYSEQRFINNGKNKGR